MKVYVTIMEWLDGGRVPHVAVFEAGERTLAEFIESNASGSFPGMSRISTLECDVVPAVKP